MHQQGQGVQRVTRLTWQGVLTEGQFTFPVVFMQLCPVSVVSVWNLFSYKHLRDNSVSQRFKKNPPQFLQRRGWGGGKNVRKNPESWILGALSGQL